MKPLLVVGLLSSSSFLVGTPTAQSSFSSPTEDFILARRVNQMTVGSSCAGSEGAWYCMTNTFQRCASGEWSVVMDCAPGTICEPEGLTYASQSAFGIASSGATDSASFGDGVSSSSSTTASITTAAGSTSTSTTITLTTSVHTTTAITTAITTATAKSETSAAGKTGANASTSAATGDKNSTSVANKLGTGMFGSKLATILVVLGSFLVS